MKYLVLWLCLCLAVAAQPPNRLPVPDGLPAGQKSELKQAEAALAKTEATIDAEFAEHEKHCQQVVAGTPEAERCHQERLRIEALADGYANGVKAYNLRIRAASSMALARELVPSENSRYRANAGQTHCSQFLRDFASRWAGISLSELTGTASEQMDNLAKLAHQPGSAWTEIPMGSVSFAKALAESKQGNLVVIGFKEAKPSAVNSGHVAIVMPVELVAAGSVTNSGRPGWGMQVPVLAQAGRTTGSDIPLSRAFDPDKKSVMHIYVRQHP